MCLNVKQRIPSQASEDIPVLKVLLPRERLIDFNEHTLASRRKAIVEGYDWYSPFRKTPFSITEQVSAYIKPAIAYSPWTDDYEVHEGIHSFGSLSGARHLIRLLNIVNPIPCAIFKGVIPKRSYYYEGLFTYHGNTSVSYASDALQITEQLDY